MKSKNLIKNKVSIIIISYNNFDCLKNCVLSLIKYSRGFEYEIIIVDNNSTEGDITNVISSFKDVEIKLIKNPINEGFAFANNQGMQIATGGFYLLLNNDIIFLENTIFKMIEHHNKLMLKTIIGCKLLNEDLSTQISISDFDKFFNLIGEKFFLYKVFKKNSIVNKYYQNYLNVSDPLDVESIKGAFIFGRTMDYLNLGGLDTSFFFYNEEVDFCFRFREAGGKVIYYPNSAVIHLGSISAGNVSWFKFRELHKSKIIFWQKHFTKPKAFVFILIHWLGIGIRVIIYLVIGVLIIKPAWTKKSWAYFKLLFYFPSRRSNNSD